jgi:hypothetical protein
MFDQHRACSQKEWAFCFLVRSQMIYHGTRDTDTVTLTIGMFTPHALRFTVRKVRVDEISKRKNK